MEDRQTRWEERHERVARHLLGGRGAEKNDPCGLQHPAAFARDAFGILEVVEDHRHEDQVDRRVRYGQVLALADLVALPVRPALRARLLEHALRWIDGYQRGREVLRERAREASGAAAEVENGGNPTATADSPLDSPHPELQVLGAVVAGAV